MPYYCTVPQCTSMAGKAKNVSFHQFPRDEMLAERWNIILKRGKPYTKYSKVCSRHFTATDYTITSVGKNKGQWRSLRKDAVPSQNLPGSLNAISGHSATSNIQEFDAEREQQLSQQLAHAVYVQTMLAMHAASMAAVTVQREFDEQRSDDEQSADEEEDDHSTSIETTKVEPIVPEIVLRSFQCEMCLKSFRDPDVFHLHMRSHIQGPISLTSGRRDSVYTQENVESN